MVLKAVKAHTGAQVAQVLAELAQTQPDTQLVIALGREGKVLVKPRDAQRHPQHGRWWTRSPPFSYFG
jgi:hypothetical protein